MNPIKLMNYSSMNKETTGKAPFFRLYRRNSYI